MREISMLIFEIHQDGFCIQFSYVQKQNKKKNNNDSATRTDYTICEGNRFKMLAYFTQTNVIVFI